MNKFQPIDEKEYNARNVWPAGWYSAEITDDVTERMSSNGNLMFETKFKVYNADGTFRLVTSYVMAEGKAAFQLRSCAEAFGVLEQYKSGTLSEDDLKGRTGFVKLGVQVDKEGVYPDKNVIADFRKSMPGKVKAKDIVVKKVNTKAETEQDLSDSIPF